ncbi:MAG: nucleoside kinase [Paludibacteraceae bacterium]|nr:nucleoside kinase [Paludibacteraceae bacterium]MBQ5625432.1 nucleoside kinase [Paludibacteraceae bacterium]
MQNLVTIYCKNNKQFVQIPCGTSLNDLYNQLQLELPYPVIAARVNYKVQSLNFLIYKPKDIEFIDATSESGRRCYIRTLNMVMACAVRELWPDCDLRIEHPISNGFYCTIRESREETKVITPEIVLQLKARMQTIINENRPIITEERQTKEVIRLFGECNEGETTLFETLGNPYCRYYRIGDYIDYYTGALMPSTGYINLFDLELYHDNILLRIPCRRDPNCLEERPVQDKRFGIFKEYVGWNKLLHISNVGEFNKACKNQKSFEMIKLSEALHEKKVAQIADQIAHRESGVPRFVLISGPSSSGKTTFSKRLTIQLMVNGIRPVVISMDNYFVNREDTPRDENGNWDFEHLHTLDLPLFRQQVADLLEGETVSLPFYNFETGLREYRGDTLKLEKDTVVILEGLHALNPELLPNIPREAMFKIYVSSLTTVNLDNHNWIPTSDVRLIRRIVRDYRYRGYSALETIARLDSVQRGEDRWIAPFQEEADVMFNSALLFELAVLKRHAEPILDEVPKYCDEYTTAHRLKKYLSYFESIPEREIPPTSFLREFVGGSSFHY